jgi:peptidyl-prolyl cis-trans isomerase B (cyclophilin B)
VPSDKRQRQREAREARLAAEARAKKRRTQIRNFSILGVVILLVVGIVFLVSGNSKKPPKSTSGTTTTTTATTAADAKAQKAANKVAEAAGCPANPDTPVNTQRYTAAPAMTINTNALYSATVVTTAGTFQVSLYAKSAPNTVNNFVFLADKGYYKCNTFFRVATSFVDQTGDPSGTGTGVPKGTAAGALTPQPGYKFNDENLPKAYTTGDLAMANSGANTNGSQFFIVAPGGAAGLASSYSLFGQVSSGLNVVDLINKEGNTEANNGEPPLVIQRIISITIHEASAAVGS